MQELGGQAQEDRRLTPAKERESPKILLLGEERHEDEAVEVEAFHQDPVVVGGQEVQEQGDSHLAAHLGDYKRREGVLRGAAPRDVRQNREGPHCR